MRDGMAARNEAERQASTQMQQAFVTFETSDLNGGDLASKHNFGESNSAKQCPFTLGEQAERMALSATRNVVRQIQHYVGSM